MTKEKLARLAEVSDLSEVKATVDKISKDFKDATSPYRSDREQLQARVRELEAEVERWRAYSKKKRGDPFTSCPKCETTRKDGAIIATYEREWDTLGSRGHLGLTTPKLCGFWYRSVCFFHSLRIFSDGGFERWCMPHFHQRCTACGARWVVDAEGWRFD